MTGDEYVQSADSNAEANPNTAQVYATLAVAARLQEILTYLKEKFA